MTITVLGRGAEAAYPDAQSIVNAATLLVGGQRHLDAFDLPESAETVVLGPLEPALDAIAAHRGPVVVLASGDPGFFGIVRALAERLPDADLKVLPAVPSVAVAFARIGVPWEDAAVVSAHGRDLRRAVNTCLAHPKVAVLTAPGSGPRELAAALRGSGRDLVVLERLGEADEAVSRVTAAEAAAREWSPLSVVLVLDRQHLVGPPRTVAGPPRPPEQWALPEAAFAHRDSMISKSEVRALALARLGPALGDLVWDVGAGSGSVAVECARFGAAVIAVERDPAACATVSRNAVAHDVRVQVVEGSAPGALDDLPLPDAVFVGGGGPDVVGACARRQPRRIVAALSAVDRVPAVLRVLGEAGFSAEGVQLQASRLAPLPDGAHRLTGTNPVFVVSGTRR